MENTVQSVSTSWIALIRAIGPATHGKMSMKQLREGCAAAGLDAVRTYIASGNVLFRSGDDAADLRARIMQVIHRHELDNAVFLRTAQELGAVLRANPFPDATAERPNHVLAVFLQEPPSREGLSALLRHPGPERIAAAGREIFIDYVDGVARSRVTPAMMERHLGQPGTARNMNTVKALWDLAREP